MLDIILRGNAAFVPPFPELNNSLPERKKTDVIKTDGDGQIKRGRSWGGEMPWKRKKRFGCSLHTRVQTVPSDPQEKGQWRRPRFHKVSGSIISRKRIESVVLGPRRLCTHIFLICKISSLDLASWNFLVLYSSKKRLQSITAKKFVASSSLSISFRAKS